MKLLVRMDDITEDMDMKRFLRIKDILDKYDVKPLIGVVPDNQDEKLHHQEDYPLFWELISNLIAEGWTVAQHGAQHIYSTKDSGLLRINQYSEFAGVSFSNQLDLISYGQQILVSHGISLEIFMAPGHSFDKNTIKALKALGFKAITDGLYKKPYIRDGLLFIPCRFLGDRCNDFDTLCIHSNTISDNSINELERLFCQSNIDFIDWNLDTLTSQATQYNVFIWLYEKAAILKRRLRNYVANSERLTSYMVRSNSTNNKVKLIKRVIMLPSLFLPIYDKDEKQ